jgi:FtsH-binding integral membrane protein
MFEFLEGNRTFELIYGFTTGGLCLALAIPLLYWVLPQHRRSFFGERIDPNYVLQLAYGIFCMAMAFTDIGCRAIPHGELAFVHPTFFFMTLLLAVTIGPRLIVMLRTPKHTSAH